MINVDLQQLVQALDAETRRELEAAAERCLQRGGSKILVEDLLLSLLERRDGLLARALQHEIDHLNGVLYVDLMDYEIFDEDDEDDRETVKEA